ncbi:MAG: methyltransferase domain-containing protein [Gammaproteobacteria bacterium]|nr:methyltransferase domain-containing protein [Gammaproteobacteria bacterium]
MDKSSPATGINWCCPVCGLILHRDDKVWLCANAHSFDIARQGYVNLLLAQQKKSRQPGDDQQAVEARRKFLQQGHYQPLIENISDLLQAWLPAASDDGKYRLLDCGCGEGWYIQALQETLPADKLENVEFAGLDISRPAILNAAKSVKNATFAIASAFSIPLPAQSLDCVLQVFAPASDEEIHRILKTDGLLIRVTPAQNHLLQLREQLYPDLHQRDIEQPDKNCFEKIREQRSTFGIVLQSSEAINSLLRMTPHFWKANTSRREELLAKESLQVSADMLVSVYRKLESVPVNPWQRRATQHA